MYMHNLIMYNVGGGRRYTVKVQVLYTVECPLQCTCVR